MQNTCKTTSFISPANQSKNENRPLKVALVSCGLGRVKRGVEVSTARWYEALKEEDGLEVRLFSGGEYPGATHIDNIPRDLALNTVLAPFTYLNGRRTWEFCYGLEQMTFAAGFGSTLLSWQPDIVWTKETPFAHVLVYTRPFFNLKYKLIFSNGSGFKPSTYAHFDFIQHLHQDVYDEAIAYGIPAEKMAVIPNIIRMPKVNLSKAECRKRFNYSSDDWVIICAAAWNCYHKRIDYLIQEVAKISDERVKLLLCGQPEADTPYLKKLAQKLLPGRVQWHTLEAKDIPIALKAADIFVLPSTEELFGGVVIEAMMLGLPVITHQKSVDRQFHNLDLPKYDLSVEGNLTQYLVHARQTPLGTEYIHRLAQTVQDIYGEEMLCQNFIETIKRAIYQR